MGELAARFGADALAEGYTAIPTTVLRRRRALGITAPEWDLLTELFARWRAGRDPYPGSAALAAALDVDESTVRRHRQALQARGLLRVYRAGPRTCYDLSPLLRAATRFVQQDEHGEPPALVGGREDRASLRAGRAEMHAEEEIMQRDYAYDRPPLSPQAGVDVIATLSGREAPGTPPASAPYPSVPAAAAPGSPDNAGEDGPLAARLAAIGAGLGDDTPRSSLRRAQNLRGELGVEGERFLAAVDDAARRVRERAPVFHILGSSGRPNGMHYFFGVLRRELRGARRCSQRHARRDAAAGGEVAAAAPQPAAPSGPGEGQCPPLWALVREELRATLPAPLFAARVLPLQVRQDGPEALVIEAASEFERVWLTRVLARRIDEALRAIGREGVRVRMCAHAA